MTTIQPIPQPEPKPFVPFVQKPWVNPAATAPAPVDTITDTLVERGNRYGPFEGHAEITQHLKDEMRKHRGWLKLNESQREALEMIAHKIGRILNGDPNYADSWHDISGYATLIDKQLNGKGL